MEFKCEHCNKFYSSFQSRCNHYRKFHKSDDKPLINNYKPTDKPFDKHLINTKLKIINDENIILEKKYFCKKCDKQFEYYQSRWRHEKICKDNKKEILELQNIEIKKQLDDLKLKINKMNKRKSNNTNNTNNGTIINGNGNGIVNNNIHINGLGSENIIGKLTENEKINLLTGLLFKEVPYVELIRKVYNDGKFLEDRNTMITNLQTKTCFAYNKENNKFDAKNKNEQIDDIIDYRQKDIKDLYQEMQDNKKIKSNARKLIEDYIEKFDNLKNTESYRKNKEEIIYIIYNCKEIMRKLKDDLDGLEDKSMEI